MPYLYICVLNANASFSGHHILNSGYYKIQTELIQSPEDEKIDKPGGGENFEFAPTLPNFSPWCDAKKGGAHPLSTV